MTEFTVKPCPCPWCGMEPKVGPEDPEQDGDAFGFVECVTDDCVAQPVVYDGEDCADNRSSNEYKIAAIVRWNRAKHWFKH